jgi:hypothetical protein
MINFQGFKYSKNTIIDTFISLFYFIILLFYFIFIFFVLPILGFTRLL